MKENEFIVNKWYKSKWNNYFKFLKIENNTWYSSEGIINETWTGAGDWWVGGMGILVELKDLSEIKQYLPDNHPDKIEIKQDYDYLIPFLKNLE